MAVAVAFTDVWTDGRRIHAIGTLTFSGNYAAGGDSVAIKAATGASIRNWKSRDHPLHVMIQGKGGYFYEYDLANRKVKVRQQRDPAAAGGADIPFTELAAAAYPAGVTGDVVAFYAIGKKV